MRPKAISVATCVCLVFASQTARGHARFVGTWTLLDSFQGWIKITSVATLLLLALTLAAADVHAQAIRPGFRQVRPPGISDSAGDAAVLKRELQGIGTLHAPGGTEAVDLLIRKQPRDSAAVIAYVGFFQSADHSDLVMGVAANEPHLIGEFTRVSHDDYGLIVDRVRGDWVRTIYGYTPAGVARRGWVRLVPDRVRYTSYDEQILRYDTWFEDPGAVELFDRPNGRRLRFPMPPLGANDNGGYHLTVLTIKGSWIAVQVTVPNTNPCGGNPDATVERSTQAWVRRHDRRGRYQIAYAAAGC